ncbi:hypothetical protein DV515_00002493 [Chloebia gouldiae]|uniref:Uncharacterized protein n=1 Tax=Chloebia gouldiae TaxID=44316 RepID=A0A3L8SY85_CHLGU|nr:hypothetical protein DV515_00002493 [Chloebia gouldiae]
MLIPHCYNHQVLGFVSRLGSVAAWSYSPSDNLQARHCPAGQCRFCVGDKFFLKNNMILCQMDYEEGQLNGSFESQVQ